jgi:uncharacterized membrane protein YeiH
MYIMDILEMVGTIAFAISGALVGINKGLDSFGVIVLSITTAVGGGIFRDILIGNTPPIAFRDPVFCLVSTAAALFTFYYYHRLQGLTNIIQLFDAIGLGAFTSIGANVAVQNNLTAPFIIVSLGLFTGVGGGIVRDVFAKEIPFVFRKEIYAVAAILGGLSFVFLRPYVSEAAAMYICFFVTLFVRLLSLKFNLQLPIVEVNSNTSKEL